MCIMRLNKWLPSRRHFAQNIRSESLIFSDLEAFHFMYIFTHAQSALNLWPFELIILFWFELFTANFKLRKQSKIILPFNSSTSILATKPTFFMEHEIKSCRAMTSFIIVSVLCSNNLPSSCQDDFFSFLHVAGLFLSNDELAALKPDTKEE